MGGKRERERVGGKSGQSKEFPVWKGGRTYTGMMDGVTGIDLSKERERERSRDQYERERGSDWNRLE